MKMREWKLGEIYLEVGVALFTLVGGAFDVVGNCKMQIKPTLTIYQLIKRN